MNSNFLYSIGHGNKSIDEFIHELRLYNIQYLVDVRNSIRSLIVNNYK